MTDVTSSWKRIWRANRFSGKREDKVTNSSIARTVEVKLTQAPGIPFLLTWLLARTHFSFLSNCRIPQLLLHPCIHIRPEPVCRMVSWLSGPMGDQCSQALRDKRAGKYIVGRLSTSAPTEDDPYTPVHPFLMGLKLSSGFTWAVSKHPSMWEGDHPWALGLFSQHTGPTCMYVCPPCLLQLTAVSRVSLPVYFFPWYVLPPPKEEMFVFFPRLVFQLRVLTLLWGDVALTGLEACSRGRNLTHDTIIVVKGLAEEALVFGHPVTLPSKYLCLCP